MAIIIPSKKIYDQTHKLPKAYIDKVEWAKTNLNYSVQYMVLAKTISTDLTTDTSWQNNPINQHDDNSAGDTRWNGSKYIYHEAVAHIETYYVKLTITIDKYQADGLKEVLKLYKGWKDEQNGVPNISCIVTYDKGEGDFDFKNENDFNFDYEFNTNSTDKEKIEDSYTYIYVIGQAIALRPSTTVEVVNKENIVNPTITVDTNGNYNIELIAKVGNKYWGYGQNKDDTVNSPVISRTAVHSVYKKPLSLEVSFVGDVGTYAKVEIPMTEGTGKNVFAIETNELVQGGSSNISVDLDTITLDAEHYGSGVYGLTVTRNSYFGEYLDFSYSFKNTRGEIEKRYYFMQKGQNQLTLNAIVTDKPDSIKLLSVSRRSNTGKDISEQIIVGYKNGKETADLLCSIGEYKDENGNLALSTKDNDLPMTFQNGDIVVPYKFTARGDAPLSTTKDGKPKKFLVTAVEFIFDGASWQKIALQEK